MENQESSMEKSKTSIAKKMILWIVGSSIGIAALISAVYLYDDYQKKLKAVERQLIKIEESVEKSLSSDLYAENEENARLQLEGVLKQPDMVQVQIWNIDDIDPMISLVNKEFEDLHPMTRRALGIHKIVPIFALDGDGNLTKEKIADMHLTVSLGGAKKKIRDQIILFGLIQLIQVSLISLIIWFIFKKLVSRHLSHMAAYADAMDLNDLSGDGLKLNRKESNKLDELDNLVISFNDMRTNLKEAHAALSDYAVNLEKKVAERTKEIEEEREKVAGLLNNMRQAVFSIDRSQKVVAPVSSFSKNVFGSEIEGTDIFDTIYKDLDRQSEEYSQLHSALNTVFGEDDLQYDLMEDYFIQKAKYKESEEDQESKVLQFSYNPMFDNKEELDKVMFIVEDVTELEKLAAEKAAKDKEIATINEIASNKIDDVKAFILSADSYIKNSIQPLEDFKSDQSKAGGLGEIFRNLHTLKGNSRIFNLGNISQTTHIVENDLVQMIEEVKEGKEINHDRIKGLFEGFNDIEQSIAVYLEIGKRIFSFGSADEITISKKQIEEIQGLIENVKTNQDELKQASYCIKKIIFNSFIEECGKFKKMVQEIAGKLDKKAEFNISGEDIFLDNTKLDLIFDALTHILRNSIDHGIETMEKRKEKSKSEHGTISIKTKEEGDQFEIFIVDDGNGIDGERVMSSAVKKGALAKEKADAMSDEDKVNLIFLPNLSTADSVSDISGRGVGMDVVKSNIEKMGGSIRVSSILGTGTIFKISFPTAA
tara:strand:- start:13582 stop:15879 length:2298 start_codon:yes stop_codon:yes gene_type:complete